MEERHCRPLTVSDVASAAGMSRSWFSRVFREQTGMTPKDKLTAARMEHARALLADPSACIKAVASSVGVPCVSTFERSFRKAYGVSPTGYRRANALAGREAVTAQTAY